ncbi:MAG TPA: HAD hydrolase-like protein [Caulobacteraceae bacterium]|jgi:phosphoglycolate phosphatase|nr:HAD hydrolase-like protein [Caulobacteraceae bacterium]
MSAPGLLTGVTLAFDLDGTLVDTAPDLIGVLNQMLEEHGLPPVPLASARHLVGGGARRMLQHGFEEAGATVHPDEMPALDDRFVELYRARIARESRPFDGLEPALDALKAEGARFVVCTNKKTDLSLDLLAAVGLIDRFDAVAGPDVVSRRKPDPAHLIEAIRLGGGDPTRALMVGDSATDLLSARGARIPVVLVSFGYTETPVEALGADALIHRFHDLPAAARRLLR